MRHNTNEESPSNAIKRLSTAMVVIYLMVQYNLVRGFSEEDAVVLCESLLLRPPTEDGMYRDVEAVAKNFITCKAYVYFYVRWHSENGTYYSIFGVSASHIKNQGRFVLLLDKLLNKHLEMGSRYLSFT